MARRAADLSPRVRVVLTGVIGEVRVRAARAGRGPLGLGARGVSLEAWLDDGSALVLLRWLGRAGIPGIVPGASLRVEGTVAEMDGDLVIVNPRYGFTDAGSSTSW